MLSCLSGSAKMVYLLLSYKLDPNTQDEVHISSNLYSGSIVVESHVGWLDSPHDGKFQR